MDHEASPVGGALRAHDPDLQDVRAARELFPEPRRHLLSLRDSGESLPLHFCGRAGERGRTGDVRRKRRCDREAANPCRSLVRHGAMAYYHFAILDSVLIGHIHIPYHPENGKGRSHSPGERQILCLLNNEYC